MPSYIRLGLEIAKSLLQIMIKPKAINRKKLVAFVLPIIRKEKLPMSEELEKLRHKQYVAERKLTAAKGRVKIFSHFSLQALA